MYKTKTKLQKKLLLQQLTITVALTMFTSKISLGSAIVTALDARYEHATNSLTELNCSSTFTSELTSPESLQK